MHKVQTINVAESMNYCVLRELEAKKVLSSEVVATPDKHILHFLTCRDHTCIKLLLCYVICKGLQSDFI